MKLPLRGGARPAPAARAASFAMAIVVAVTLAACGESRVSTSPRPNESGGSSVAPSAPATPSPTPSPTPLPTPQHTNSPDPELSGLIPERIAGATVQVPPVEDFAITPGDFGEAYGELGLRFTALQLAYIEQPRLSLYAARVGGDPVSTEELEPYLETAGQYVGIAGLVREPWTLEEIDGRVVWVRPEDNATAAGTMIYTWAADEFVFLMIGVDDAVNRAMFAALPGEAAPTPTPRPSRSPRGSGTPAASASPS